MSIGKLRILLLKKLAVKVKSMRIGNGIDEATVIGPMIDRNAVEKAAEHVEDAVHLGATIVTGGKEWQGNLGGHFYEPTILVDVNDQMKVMNEETFGPVLPIETFDSIEEVIEKANQLPYGLAAYIMTESTNRVFQLSESLEYGIIGVNDVFPATAEAPFGGHQRIRIWKRRRQRRNNGIRRNEIRIHRDDQLRGLTPTALKR
jgi:succinate-semialdehyde dehydrogenase/glutarate-semialdehyde dehydrogenase